MASKSVGNLAVNLIARTKGFTSGMKKATKRLKKFGAGIAGIGKRVAKFGAALVAVSVGAMVVFTKQAFASIDVLAKTSDSLGIAIKQLTGLQHAAAITGVSSEAFNKSLKRMIKSVGDASVGLSTQVRAFESIGLKVEDLKNLAPEQQFRLIADALNKVTNNTAKVSAATDIFGKSGAQLINTFALGTEGLDAYQAEAEKLGIALDRVDAAQVEAANDAITRMMTVFKGFFQQVAVKLAPVIEALAKRFTEMALAGSGVGPMAAKGFAMAVKAISVMADAVHFLGIGFLNLRRIMLEVFAKAVKGSIGALKAVLKLSTALPGTSILVNQLAIGKKNNSALIESSQKMADQASEAYNKSFFKDPPSIAINHWVEDVVKKTRAAAEEASKKGGKDGGLLGGLLSTGTGGLKGLESGLAGIIGKAGGQVAALKQKTTLATLKAQMGIGLPAAKDEKGKVSALASNSAGAALQRGSVEAYRATRFAKRGDDEIKKVAKNTEKQVGEGEKANEWLGAIAGFLRPVTGDLI